MRVIVQLPCQWIGYGYVGNSYWTLMCVTICKTEVTATIGKTEVACGINAIVSYGTLTYLTLAQLASTQTIVITLHQTCIKRVAQ